ncbi:DUF2897 family protein, partial [Pseudomonas sp. S36]|nr:DUF2897 family protein [Pseudomonas sp. S36]
RGWGCFAPHRELRSLLHVRCYSKVTLLVALGSIVGGLMMLGDTG